MIILMHLVAGRIPTTLGPGLAGWATTVMVVFLVAAVAVAVAIWNRSQYRR
jgi:hypothetical protein